MSSHTTSIMCTTFIFSFVPLLGASTTLKTKLKNIMKTRNIHFFKSKSTKQDISSILFLTVYSFFSKIYFFKLF